MGRDHGLVGYLGSVCHDHFQTGTPGVRVDMSHYVEECYFVYQERTVRARVEHLCGACGEKISIDHRYIRVSIVFDESARTVKRCLRCQKIHLHVRSLDPFGESWPNEDLSCGKDYKEEWGVDPPPNIQDLAFITPDEAQEVIG